MISLHLILQMLKIPFQKCKIQTELNTVWVWKTNSHDMVETKEDDCICTKFSKDLDTSSELKYSTTFSCKPVTHIFFTVLPWVIQDLLKWSQFKISGPMSPCEFNQCKGRTAGFFRETVQANQNFPSCKRTAFQPNHSEFLVRKQEFLERIRKQDSGSPSCVWIHSLVSSTAQPLDQSQYKCYQYSN